MNDQKAVEGQDMAAPRLDFIDGCRGLAIFVVLLFHAMIWCEVSVPESVGNVVTSVGRAGVDLFLVLSGFCLTWPLVSRKRGQILSLDLTTFACRRIKRILPPYLFALAVAVAANAGLYAFGGVIFEGRPYGNFFPTQLSEGIQNLLAHLFLVHGFTPWHHHIDGAFWSLSLEWQFYWLFPLLILVARKGGIGKAFLFTILVTVGFRLAVRLFDSGLVWNAFYNETAFARWCEFGAGAFLASCVACGSYQNWQSWTFDGVAAGSLILAGAVISLRSSFFLNPILCGLTAACFLLAASVPSSLCGRIARMRSLQLLGEISYSLYLLHGSVFMCMAIPMSRLHLGGGVRVAIYYGLGLPLAVGIACLAYKYIESPFLRKRAIQNESKRVAETVNILQPNEA